MRCRWHVSDTANQGSPVNVDVAFLTPGQIYPRGFEVGKLNGFRFA